MPGFPSPPLTFVCAYTLPAVSPWPRGNAVVSTPPPPHPPGVNSEGWGRLVPRITIQHGSQSQCHRFRQCLSVQAAVLYLYIFFSAERWCSDDVCSDLRVQLFRDYLSFILCNLRSTPPIWNLVELYGLEVIWGCKNNPWTENSHRHGQLTSLVYVLKALIPFIMGYAYHSLFWGNILKSFNVHDGCFQIFQRDLCSQILPNNGKIL